MVWSYSKCSSRLIGLDPLYTLGVSWGVVLSFVVCGNEWRGEDRKTESVRRVSPVWRGWSPGQAQFRSDALTFAQNSFTIHKFPALQGSVCQTEQETGRGREQCFASCNGACWGRWTEHEPAGVLSLVTRTASMKGALMKALFLAACSRCVVIINMPVHLHADYKLCYRTR